MVWQLQEAKNKLSRLIKDAQTSGPQIITLRGKASAVVLSSEDYRKLTSRTGSIVDFFQASPWADIEFDVERSRDTGREVSL